MNQIVQRGKYCVTNTFIREIRKEKPSNNIKIRNPSKISSPKYIKVTESHKIATSIDNIVKKLANIHELWTEPTERTVKFWLILIVIRSIFYLVDLNY